MILRWNYQVKWYAKTLVERNFSVQVRPRCFSHTSYSLFICQQHRRYHMCDCFFSTFLFSPHRKTLQLNRTGATKSPLFPQADFSGNYFSLLSFAGPLRISSRDPVTSPGFFFFVCFSWAHSLLQGLNVPMRVPTLAFACTCAHSHLDPALFSCAAESQSLPSWQLWSVQVRSYITNTGAGLAWWAAGHGGGRVNPQLDGKESNRH